MKAKRKQDKRKQEWFDNDDFWRDLYPFMFPVKRFIDAPAELEKLLSLAGPNGKTALDLCCGPGRFSIALARKGFRVAGVDRTGYLLEKAKAGARKAKVEVEWIQADMRDFIRPESFDLAISMFTSFGYFDDKKEDLVVLGNIFASLKAGGVCVIDVTGKEILAKIFQGTTSDIMPDGTKLINQHSVFDDWTRVRNEWILVRNGRAKTFRFHHTIYSGQELRHLLEQAGFVEVRLYGNLDGDEYGLNATRLVAVGVKP